MTQAKTYKDWLELAQEFPDRYTVKDGLVVDREKAKANKGHGIVASFPEHNPHAITKENSAAMHQRRTMQKLRSRIKGRIDGVREWAKEEGVNIVIPDPDEITEEELLTAEGDADRLISKLFTKAFLRAAKDSKNFRGLSEGYPKVMDMISEDPRARDVLPSERGVIAPVPVLMELLEQIQERQQAALDRARAIEAEAWASGQSKPVS